MPRPRTPGRPSGEAQQRERLLDAACQRFAQQGIQASSLRGIAEAAQVTPALIHYYFGNKPKLTQAVIDERLMPEFERLAGCLEQAGDTPLEQVRTLVTELAAIVAKHPWLPQLWAREVLTEGGALRSLLTQRIAPLLPLRLAQRFAAAQQRGELHDGIDPRLLVVSLIGATMLPYAAAPLWRGIFASAEIADQRMVEHTLALFAHGLEVPDGH
ncbi:HTH-type transcriptional repressor NicS [Pseudomonas sp. THAF187a]|uniref:TetR/AcrR family transcriptional regulator n=1 Tax=unclassified Pseudomonas TaxID=196821 RepID=UPI001268A114|nr:MULTISPECIES: TetR/AcrR family transcriptional regulator [unclassified Pseudomonas]QFT21420.1 HTH-type transcriptional repressor NicS [Pseudomonas sp. THAF187a]QFT41608.1 HTH-type transcriptional repressor NicS [Pseudomonas sp. THAF42]